MSGGQQMISENWNRRSKTILRELRSHLETVADMQLNPMQINEAAALIAGLCLTLSKELETRSERKQSHQLSQLMNDDLGQLFSTLLTDRVPRLSDGTDVTRQARRVLSTTGIPQSMPLLDQCQLVGLKLFGSIVHLLEHKSKSIQGNHQEGQTNDAAVSNFHFRF